MQEASYAIDAVLALIFEHPEQSETPESRPELRVRIKRHAEPWTLSCGMVVEVVEYPCLQNSHTCPQVGQPLFLKMFDRRFAHQLRRDNDAEPWSQEIEDDYAASLLSGKIDHFLHRLRTEENFQDETEDGWDNAEKEAFLHSQLLGLCSAETAAYQRLSTQQGTKIPCFHGRVVLNIPSFQIPGILIDYLPGFTLSAMPTNVPRDSWQAIVNDAVSIARLLGDKHVLNTDVRPDNFMVVPEDVSETEGKHYHVYMIDFGQCRLRGPDESDAVWGRAKWGQDEEGAVGFIMRMRLRKLGFTLSYEPSMRYLEWAPGEDD